MMKMTALTMVAVLVASGCGTPEVRSIAGVVTLDGVPVDLATITFVPEESTSRGGIGRTDAEGKFDLTTDGQDGLEDGQYRVIITKMALGKPGQSVPAAGSSAVPAIYQNPDTTPIKVTLPLQGKLVVELKSEN